MNQTRKTIPDYYKDKTILITGATGFIGKVLIWKLLQSCSSLDTIFILVRPKKGKNKDSRVTELLQVPIFEKFKKDNNKQLLEKVKAIAGDIGEDNLGISEEDERKLIDSVHIIFHTAATVKFDADLKDAINLNVEGTQRLLELATRMPKLEAFVHTSTAYCHSDVLDELEEKLYKSRESPQQIIDLVRWMKPEVLRSISNELIKPHPNTYTYSKRLAEIVVADYCPKLPVVIVRPSLVTPAQCEPISGWVDNTNGIIGLMLAMGTGVMRVVWYNRDSPLHLISVDVVCNAMVVIAWETENRWRKWKVCPLQVYNLCSAESKLFTLGQHVEACRISLCDHPFLLTLWYPTAIICKNFYIYVTLSILLQWIPACLIDSLLFSFRYKTTMIQIQRRIYRGIKFLNYFGTRKWKFVKNNIFQVRQELSRDDAEVFRLTTDIKSREYSLDVIKVLRWYVLKEDPSTLPTARRRMKVLYFLHCFVKVLFWLVLLRLPVRAMIKIAYHRRALLKIAGFSSVCR